ncbi:Uncharacterised protein [Legionella steigerwaltii]|uniref:Uncharacterized protein n=1 Tax=Legionella steigerwaltii TaxID=460 RepID=A0A378LE39_9GAMM|nr:hypothetical protein [Legionella steigerwaltii]KTD78510.1 hypothetical protein Lstg_1245 [Legionella steigerwaltii]STY24132.1 Uncharacterised protein [Legionella steigerwaltii]
MREKSKNNSAAQRDYVSGTHNNIKWEPRGRVDTKTLTVAVEQLVSPTFSSKADAQKALNQLLEKEREENKAAYSVVASKEAGKFRVLVSLTGIKNSKALSELERTAIFLNSISPPYMKDGKSIQTRWIVENDALMCTGPTAYQKLNSNSKDTTPKMFIEQMQTNLSRKTGSEELGRKLESQMKKDYKREGTYLSFDKDASILKELSQLGQKKSDEKQEVRSYGLH